jgi:hypothetical protein
MAADWEQIISRASAEVYFWAEVMRSCTGAFLEEMKGFTVFGVEYGQLTNKHCFDSVTLFS